jgi:hypothetical protein
MVFPYESTEGKELSYMEKIKDQVKFDALPL